MDLLVLTLWKEWQNEGYSVRGLVRKNSDLSLLEGIKR
jgi:hypothetical protein